MHKFSYVLAGTAIIAAILACNLPSGQQISGAVMTAAALTVQAQSAPIVPAVPAVATATFTPSPTPTTIPPTACSTAFVTATTNANVRSGPGTLYDILGYLPAGGTAPLSGRNDANTWWYIEFPAGPGGHAWIAQSVTSASCLPAVVQVIAAPPLPPTPTEVSGGGGGPFAVTHVTTSVNPPSYSGDCSDPGGKHIQFAFTAEITTNGAGTVTYYWARSDNASAPTQSLTFGSAGTQTVTTTWDRWFNPGDNESGWERIYVDNPNHQFFSKATFSVACNP